MDSVRIPWNSNIPVGIRRIPLELMGESKDLVSLCLFLDLPAVFGLVLGLVLFLHTLVLVQALILHLVVATSLHFAWGHYLECTAAVARAK